MPFDTTIIITSEDAVNFLKDGVGIIEGAAGLVLGVNLPFSPMEVTFTFAKEVITINTDHLEKPTKEEGFLNSFADLLSPLSIPSTVKIEEVESMVLCTLHKIWIIFIVRAFFTEKYGDFFDTFLRIFERFVRML